jgi:peptidoglycan/xylan/chitin deacetylase (PgdA/CDA1 family)
MSQPIATLSLDLDDKWSYLKTRGDASWANLPSYLDVVIPRALDMLRDLDLQITFFIVGQDAAQPANHAALRSIALAGHEIGNHSFHHEPWLHRYSPRQLENELTTAEDAIEAATGVRPVGFRGPGYSLSPALIASLIRRGYRYDASTLPTSLGPLARWYYLSTARLTADQKAERRKLFGGWSEALRPIRPYWWQLREHAAIEPLAGRRLLEIPVTTTPLLRTPFHLSYLLFLSQRSTALAWSYWKGAMTLCRLTGVAPSLLLHPLDFLGAEDEPDLAFFPAMRMPAAEKVAFVRAVLADFQARFAVLPLGEFAKRVGQRQHLPTRTVATSLELAAPHDVPAYPPSALAGEGSRR